MANNYWNKFYHMRVQEVSDEIIVDKTLGSDWCEIKMLTHGRANGEITIRSRNMAEQLHFMLGQMLTKENG